MFHLRFHWFRRRLKGIWGAGDSWLKRWEGRLATGRTALKWQDELFFYILWKAWENYPIHVYTIENFVDTNHVPFRALSGIFQDCSRHIGDNFDRQHSKNDSCFC